MPRLLKASHIGLLLGLLGFLALAIDALRYAVTITDESCQQTAAAYQMAVPDQAHCQIRGLFAQRHFLLFPNNADTSPKLSIPGLSTSGRHLVLSVVNDGKGRFNLIDKATGTNLAGSFSAISNWSQNGLSKITLDIPQNHPGVSFEPMAGSGQLLVGLVTQETGNAPALAASHRPDHEVASSWGFWLLVALVAGSAMIICRLSWQQMPRPPAGLVLCVGLFLVAVFFGSPFGPQVNVITDGDDLSYYGWATAMGYDLNPDLTQHHVQSWAQAWNHHPWGTGILLAPSMLLQKIVLPGTIGPGAVTFSLLSYNSLLLALLAVLVYFAAMRQIFSMPLALTLAIGTLVGTCLLKFAFIRPVFSHAPEAFAISLMTYCFVRRYLVDSQNLWLAIGLALAGMLAIQIRRENVLLALLPAYWELLRLVPWRQRLKGATGFGFAAGAGVVILQLTNYFTKSPSFFHTPTSRHLGFSHMAELVGQNFYSVMFQSEGGLFAFWNIPAYLALLAVILWRRQWRLSLPLVATVAAYVTMCLIHEFPHGMEWQNRFLLKVTPIIFIGAGYACKHPALKRWQPLMIALLLGSFAYESFVLYPTQLPSEVPFYRDLFTDDQLLWPQDISRQRLLFMLPIVVLAVASLASQVMLVRRQWQRDKQQASH